MAFRSKSKKYGKRYAKRYAKRAVKKIVRRSSIKRVVKAVIKRESETKTTQRYNLGQGLVPSNSASFQSNIIELGPGSTMVISQGSGQGQRVGNRISTVSHTFRGHITPLPWTDATNQNPRPTHVKMWIFYDKADPVAQPSPITYPFFQDGSGVVGFANELIDHWRPVNTDRYRVLVERTFKVGFSQYAGTASTVANQTANQAFSNNDYKLTCPFFVNLTKHQLKTIRYNDTNNEPVSRRMFCMFQPVDATGTNMADFIVPCSVTYMEDYRYKDM